MEKVVEYISKEWTVVSAAPVTFVLLAILMFCVSYTWHREIIARLKDQKKIRDDDLAYLKNKTGSSDLKSVIDRVAAIERELTAAGETDLVSVFNKGLRISDLPPAP